MTRFRWTVGVDFGGTNVKVGLVRADGRVLRTHRLASREIGRPASFIAGVADAVKLLAREAGVTPARLAGVGIGAPGPVDVARGIVHSMVNVPGWREVPLAGLLARRLRCRCVVENDANLFALGEWRFGAGQGSRDLICLTLGTGVGGGLMLNGRLYRGTSGAAGELGHMVIDPDGPRCACGARGCLEAHVGTAAILRMGRAAMRAGAARLTALVHEAQGALTPALISQAARAGDRAAKRIWCDVGRWLGIGLANLTNLLNPERIVIGGGLSNAWPFFAPALRETLRAQAMAVPASSVRIIRAQLGNRAGIVGAAVLVWSE